MNPVISLKNVSKNYQLNHRKERLLFLQDSKTEDFSVLKNITFNVLPGETFGIIGENGSGKTTLLKIISGIITPNSGTLKTDGKILSFLDVGAGLQEDLTGRENIYFYGSLLGFKKKEIDEKFNEIVEFSKLHKFIDVRLKNYSAGMKVRLAFAVALSHDPDILLIDEIMAVGDETFQKNSIEKIKKLKNSGKTIIFVSHDLNLVKDICDRVLFLKNGCIEGIGESEQIIFDYLVDVAQNGSYAKTDYSDDDVSELKIKENALEKDIRVLEEKYSKKKDEKLEHSILSFLDKNIELKQERLKKLKIINEKISTLNQIRHMLDKKLSYTLNTKKRSELYVETAKILLKTINLDTNPYTRRSLIAELINIVPRIKNKISSIKEEVNVFLEDDKELNNIHDIRNYYEKMCLKFQFYPEKISTVKKSIDDFTAKLTILAEKNKKYVLQFIMGELDQKLNERGYQISLKVPLINNFLNTLLELNFNPDKNEILIIKECSISVCAQIEENIIKLKQEPQINNTAKTRISELSLFKKNIVSYSDKLTSTKAKNSGKVKITQILLKDKKGNITDKFLTNEKLTIEMHYEAKEKIMNPVFGLAFYSEEGFHIYGPNTKFHNYKIEFIKGNGKIKFKIVNLPLLNGSYYVSGAIHPFDSFKPYDISNKKTSFEVRTPGKEDFGFVNMKGKWEKD